MVIIVFGTELLPVMDLGNPLTGCFQNKCCDQCIETIKKVLKTALYPEIKYLLKCKKPINPRNFISWLLTLV